MSKSQVVGLAERRYLFLGALVVALLVILPLPAAAAGISGDAAYDPAAGAYPELFVVAWSSFSGDDAYDLAAGSYPYLFIDATFASFSGDDAYDPAAGGLSALAGNWPIEVASCSVPSLEEVGSYSGDDLYDPAVVGIAEIWPVC
jgi:hypothetical protein